MNNKFNIINHFSVTIKKLKNNIKIYLQAIFFYFNMILH